MNRAKDWYLQGIRDIEAAEVSNEKGFCEWACFMCQQGVEKILKAIAQINGMELWGHNLVHMLTLLKQKAALDVPDELFEHARKLDKLYISPRYPNGVPEGTPSEYFSKKDGEDALLSAKAFVRWSDALGFGQGGSG